MQSLVVSVQSFRRRDLDVFEIVEDTFQSPRCVFVGGPVDRLQVFQLKTPCAVGVDDELRCVHKRLHGDCIDCCLD